MLESRPRKVNDVWWADVTFEYTVRRTTHRKTVKSTVPTLDVSKMGDWLQKRFLRKVPSNTAKFIRFVSIKEIKKL